VNPDRSPAIRAVDRLALVDPRCLRMNGLWPGHCYCRTALYRNCSCRLPLRDELAARFCRFLGDLERVYAPRTCRKSRGSRRCSVAGQIQWFQQLDVHKRLIQRRILKPDHCAQGIVATPMLAATTTDKINGLRRNHLQAESRHVANSVACRFIRFQHHATSRSFDAMY
jgi:hypothetical protein